MGNIIMKSTNNNCADSNKCSETMRAADPLIVSILHVQGDHIIHYREDYDEQGNLTDAACDFLKKHNIDHPKKPKGILAP